MERVRAPSLIKAFFFNHWGGLVLALGLSHLVIGGYLSSMRLLPMYFGQETMSTVIEKKPVPVTRKSVSYRLVYRFTDGSGAEIEDEAPVSREFFNRVSEGDRLRTMYLSVMPTIHSIEGGMTSGIGVVLTLIGVPIVIAGLLLFLNEARKVRDGEPGNILATR